MSGFFGVASQNDCVMDLFFGVDYHSHLGTRRGGMAVYGKDGFQRSIHNIENSPFRTKFEKDVEEFAGNIGIGCISDSESQPLLVNSHLGSFAITTVGRVNNLEELKTLCFEQGKTHFLEMSGGEINPTEMVAALINQKESIVEGIQHAQKLIKGSMSILIMTSEGIMIRLPMEQVKLAGRNTQGVRLIKVAEGSTVSSVEVVDKSEEETEESKEE